MRYSVRKAGILLAAILAVSLYGCSSGQTASTDPAPAASDSASASSNNTQEPASGDQEPEAASNESQSGSGTYTIGDVCTTDRFQVKLTDGGYKDRIEDGQYYYYEASSGNTFLILVFDIENISNDAQTIQTVSDFFIYVDGYQVEQTSFGYSNLAVTINGTSYNPLSSDIINPQVILQPGRKALGYLAVEIPNTWSKCEVEFDGATFVCTS